MENLKPLRVSKGYSQTEFGLKVGVNQSCVASWERGATCPSADRLPKIAKMLGCSIDELFSAEEKEAG